MSYFNDDSVWGDLCGSDEKELQFKIGDTFFELYEGRAIKHTVTDISSGDSRYSVHRVLTDQHPYWSAYYTRDVDNTSGVFRTKEDCINWGINDPRTLKFLGREFRTAGEEGRRKILEEINREID